VGSREGRGCSSRGSEHQSLLGCTAPLAPVQSTRVQGVPRACKGCHGHARGAAGVQGVPRACKGCCRPARGAASVHGAVGGCGAAMAGVLWVRVRVLRVCAAPRVRTGLCVCPVPGVARAWWSPLRGPHKQSQGCVSGPGTPQALGMWLHTGLEGAQRRPRNPGLRKTRERWGRQQDPTCAWRPWDF